jgi:hypothetical protein
MNIALSPELKRFAEEEARARGLPGAGAYISELLRLEQRCRVPLDSLLKSRLREGARKRSERDSAMAREWFPLEEEIDGQGEEE